MRGLLYALTWLAAAAAAAANTATVAAEAAAAGSDGSSRASKQCEDLARIKSRNANIDVFWINLDASVARRKFMETQLAFYGFVNNYRVAAATPRDLLLPTRLAHPELCNYLSEATIQEYAKSANLNALLHATSVTNTVDPHRDMDIEVDISHMNSKRSKQMHIKGEYTALISDHCGRKRNTLRELTVTVSHLKALYFAVKSMSTSPSSSKYALILEDDVLFPYTLKIDELVQAAANRWQSILNAALSNGIPVESL